MNITKNFFFVFTLAETLFLCIYLFSKGFLLSKDIIEVSSNCSEFHNTSNTCWLPKRYNKLIFILIDGLRYDFAYYNESISAESKEYYENNLKVLFELEKQYPYNARLSKFIADAPTTTSQRIQALTTGSLPTFIDASSNFGSESIGNEDNLIDQLRNQNRKIVGLGDDTWEKLFPGRYHRSYFFPSFKIMDLHTVDDGILAQLEKEILKPDWNVIIAHFLGVDHCGHIFGAATEQMAEKLSQMDTVIRDTLTLLDEETLLVVAGDHGMTTYGDHGGGEEDEVTSALFVYSKKPIFAQHGQPTIVYRKRDTLDKVDEKRGTVDQMDIMADTVDELDRQPDTLHQVDRKLDTVDHVDSKPDTVDHVERKHETVDQVDLVPTLALLLGVPIPYSNIGTVIPDMFEERLSSLLLNARQIYRYLDNYRSINADFLLWDDIRNGYLTLVDNPSLEGAINFCTMAKSICKSTWGQFNETVMSLSICCSTILLCIYGFGSFSLRPTKLLELFLLFNVSSLLYFFIGSISIWFMLAYLLLFASRCKLVFTTKLALSVGWFVVTCLTTFSNSYVINEHLVYNYLIASLASVQMYCYMRQSYSRTVPRGHIVLAWSCHIALLTCTRLGSISFRCREEQKWCLYEIPVFHKPLASLSFTTACTRVIITIVVIFCPILVILKVNRNFKYNFDILLTFVNSFSAVLYWLALLFGYTINLLPLLSYCITFIIIIYSISKNYFVRLKNYLFTSFNRDKYLFCKKQFIVKQKYFINDIRIVSKLINCYVIFLSNIFISILLILSSGYAISCFLMIVAGGCALVLHSLVHIAKRDPFDIKSLSVLLWFFLSQEGFYSTGHQMTFTSIHWPAAFVGFSDVNNLAAGILVGIDTFASQILFGVASPLLFFAPFLHRILRGGEIGDTYLATNEDKVVTCLTQYCASYILVHAVKVLLTSIASLILRRHLMLWAIFAPHFIFEAIAFGVTCSSVMLGYICVTSLLRIYYSNCGK